MLELANVDLAGETDTLLQSVSVRIQPGELCCIRAGVLDGSTSLLRCMAGIREPDSGRCLIDGRSPDAIDDAELPRLVSLCHESGGLVSLFDTFENIALPLVYHWNAGDKDVYERVMPVVQALNVEDCLGHRVHQLNDVQRRLICLARGLVLGSRLLLVDELQEGMSPAQRDDILDYLVNTCRQNGLSMVMTTTAGDVTHFADRHFEIRDRGLQELHGVAH